METPEEVDLYVRGMVEWWDQLRKEARATRSSVPPMRRRNTRWLSC